MPVWSLRKPARFSNSHGKAAESFGDIPAMVIRKMILSTLGFACLGVLVACAGETYLDPQEAGLTYKIQGEYAGAITGADGAVKPLGIQVIALGKNRFEAVLSPGGLPGAGWDGGEKRLRIEGSLNAEQQKARFQGQEYSLTTDGKTLVGTAPDGAQISAERKVRQSPTEGLEPPEGAIILFDGRNADSWQHGFVDDQGRLAVHRQSKKQSFRTKKTDFRGIRLHLEFMTPFQPDARGQGRGNSGVFLPGNWEVQVLDSFGLEGKDNECGGIYKVKAPRVNMAFPPLTWQTFDIEYRAGRQESPDAKVLEPSTITVRHNGVLIHENVEVDPIRPGRAKTIEGPITLQDHNNPVFYRNIWVEELPE